jgi:hypothetical protein
MASTWQRQASASSWRAGSAAVCIEQSHGSRSLQLIQELAFALCLDRYCERNPHLPAGTFRELVLELQTDPSPPYKSLEAYTNADPTTAKMALLPSHRDTMKIYAEPSSSQSNLAEVLQSYTEVLQCYKKLFSDSQGLGDTSLYEVRTCVTMLTKLLKRHGSDVAATLECVVLDDRSLRRIYI